MRSVDFNALGPLCVHLLQRRLCMGQHIIVLKRTEADRDTGCVASGRLLDVLLDDGWIVILRTSWYVCGL